jgi:uncharacterized membrane-anchored protein
MQTRNVPSTGPRYWTAISIASVFGANLGDFVSHDLHLGHMRGLPALALIFAAILLGERRSKSASEAYYWLAIVMVRTAATNLADLATHDFKLAYGWVIAGLTVLLLAVLLFDRIAARDAMASARDGQSRGVLATNGGYWTAMLIAGTLGTALGDGLAGDMGLGVGPASVILGLGLAAVFSLHAQPAFTTRAFYWVTIVAVRTTGTTSGDVLAHSLGLELSTACTGLLFALTLSMWKTAPRAILDEA